MTEIPEHLLRFAQRANNIVHNDNWKPIWTWQQCDACTRTAELSRRPGPYADLECLCGPCHDALAEEHQ